MKNFEKWIILAFIVGIILYGVCVVNQYVGYIGLFLILVFLCFVLFEKKSIPFSLSIDEDEQLDKKFLRVKENVKDYLFSKDYERKKVLIHQLGIKKEYIATYVDIHEIGKGCYTVRIISSGIDGRCDLLFTSFDGKEKILKTEYFQLEKIPDY